MPKTAVYPGHVADIERPMGDRPCFEPCPARDSRKSCVLRDHITGNSATQKIEIKLSFEKILADPWSRENFIGNN